MRTPNRSSHLFALGLSALAGSLLALAACSDSLHLDPEPVPPGTGGGGSGQGGGGGGGPCQSSADCAFPLSICDTLRSECVQCLEHRDCSFQNGTVCSEGSCVCPEQGELFCEAIGTQGQPGFQAAGCMNTQTSANNCGGCGVACFGACNVGQCAEPWEKTSMASAPGARYLHVAVWAGDRMIVWGGENGGPLNTGGMYDPATRTWTPTSLVNAPSARRRSTAVWTGTHMIVWGGEGSAGPLNDGGMFDPATNTWQALPPIGFSFPGRSYHTAVWTGADMIVWGGTSDAAAPAATLGDAAKLTVAGGIWSQITGTSPRRQHSAVVGAVSGSDKMIVYGGSDGTTVLDTVQMYDLATNAWDVAVPAASATARVDHTAVWTGSQMIIFGGVNGGPLADGWSFDNGIWNPLAGAGPSPRFGHTAVWIDGRMIVWGGNNAGDLNSGGIHDGAAWNLELAAIPASRTYHTAVATSDNRMLVWGGTIAGSPTNTGAVFTPP